MTAAPEIRRRIAAVYAILALAVFVFPGGFVNWLEERNDRGWLAAPLTLARGIEAISGAVGVKRVGQALRARFAATVGDNEG
jgi:hypothetical protein